MTRILIVDEDQNFAHTLGCHLSADLSLERSTIVYAATGEVALQQAASLSDPFDILLIDHRLRMPMDSITTMQQLMRQNPNLAAVLFADPNDDKIGLRAYEAGAFRYLAKPFNPAELVWIVRDLIERRSVSSERNWLRILSAVTERIQKARSLVELGKALVEGGLHFGFKRARIFRIDSSDPATNMLRGIAEAGIAALPNIQTFCVPLTDAHYAHAVLNSKAICFFHGAELGPGFPLDSAQQVRFPLPVGEWVGIPLLSERAERCLGILLLDYGEQEAELEPELRQLLTLFMGQATVAFEHALHHEREERAHLVDQMAQRIIERMGDPAQAGSLDKLLLAIRDEFEPYVHIDNFLITLRSQETDWLYNRLHIEGGQVRQPYWRPATERSMFWCLLHHGHALYLPNGTAEHRRKYGLQLVGTRAACSWMGVPLRIGERIIGGMMLEDDDRYNVYQLEDFHRLQLLAERLVSVIQIAWLNEQQHELNRLLELLQEASTTITVLALEKEEWLWHAMLTLATADYGACFDRAMLFLAEKGGALLQGRMAIGHLAWEQASRDWEEYVRSKTTWASYLAALRAQSIKRTPLDAKVRACSLIVGDDAFQEVLRSGKPVIVSKEEAGQRLPVAFIERFFATAYILVPMKAGERVIGIVTLDNIWERDPQRYSTISYLDTLTNQAALVYENLRKARAQEQLVKVQHEILVQAVNRPLQETLQRICEAALSITGSDHAAIYPLKDLQPELLYDHKLAADAGLRTTFRKPKNDGPTGLSFYVLRTRKSESIGDIRSNSTYYQGRRLADQPFIQQQGFAATIATPILDLHSRAPRGLLYLDYYTPRDFTTYDHEMAEAFAHLAVVAIRNWQDAEGLREKQEASRAELSQLGQVLEQSLNAESNETGIVTSLLEKIHTLFVPLAVSTGITIKEWQRVPPEPEPIEVHHYIYRLGDDWAEKRIPRAQDKSINSRAMNTRQIQNVPDVTLDANYQERSPQTQSELDVPIILDDQVIGALNVESMTRNAFNPYYEAMVKRFTDAVALALGNIRRQRNLRTVLNAVGAIAEQVEFPGVLDKIVAEIRDAVPNLSTLVIWYLDPDSQKPKLGSYFGVRDERAMQKDAPRKSGAIYTGLHSEAPIWETDVLQNPLFQKKAFVHNEGIQSTAVFPLRVKEKAIGVMFFSYRERHKFTAEERRLFPILAQVVATSINDALQLHRTQKEQKRLHATQQVTEIISTSATLDEVICRVSKALTDLYPGVTAYIARYNERTEMLTLPPGLARQCLYVMADRHYFPCQLAEMSLTSKRKEVHSAKHAQRKDSPFPICRGTRTSLGATLVRGAETTNGENRLLGVLVLESPNANYFDEDDVEIIQNVSRQVRIALERSEQEAHARFQSGIIGHTAWATPIIHDINHYAGLIKNRVKRLGAEPSLSTEGYQDLIEIEQQTTEIARRIAAVDLRREELKALEIDVLLPEWVAATLRERSVPIDLNTKLAAPNIQIMAYPKALRQAIYDLTRDAMEAMGLEESGQQITVSTIYRGEQRHVDIAIRNNGPVIPTDIQNKLFNEIFSSKGGDERGVGLLFVRAAVERMGGQVWLEASTLKAGTTFVVRLPVADTQNNS